MKMVFLLVFGLLLTLSGCAALEGNIKTEAPQPPKNTRTIEVPQWPLVFYVSEDKTSFVILGMRDPDGWPAPREITFRSDDGKKIITMKPKDAK